MKRVSDFLIIGRMLKELGPLLFIMAVTILCGIGGYLAATAIPFFTGVAALEVTGTGIGLSFGTAVFIVILSAVLRGFLKYAEQLSGHYIAFKILAAFRDKVFAQLRKLAPAKLDGKDKGELVSIITSDIELLETFYAHTIAPVMIALVTSALYIAVLVKFHWLFGAIAALFYTLLGIVLPIIIKKSSAEAGSKYRKGLGQASAFFLDSLRGIKETLMFGEGEKREKDIRHASDKLSEDARQIKRNEGIAFAASSLGVTLSLFAILITGSSLMQTGGVNAAEMILSAVLLVSSFGPVLAVSSISTTLASTVASARRVFALLDEQPIIDDVTEGMDNSGTQVAYQNVDFQYPQRPAPVLQRFSAAIKEGEITGVVGPSGSGKSTVLKLLMRFYNTDSGLVCLGGVDISTVRTATLRHIQTLISQDAMLFDDTLENNIRMGNDTASSDDVIDAAKKAAIHAFIMRLPQGYQTRAGELGDRLSAGEKQRIALARFFLRDGRMLLLDEPTSNLDVLNEAYLLKSLRQHCKDKTVVLVSHRKTTTKICDSIIEVGAKQAY